MARARFIRTLSPFPGGTKLPVGVRMYHFLPNEHGHYVAEVLRDDDYESILSIGAGYQPYGPADLAQAQKEEEEREREDSETVEITQEQIERDTAAARRSMAAQVEQRKAQNASNNEKLRKAKADQAPA